MENNDFSRLKRKRLAIPPFILSELESTDLMSAYKSRPPYQQNDYIAWITRAKKEVTKQRRLATMLTELGRGDVYMNMAYKPKK
ncbi:MAG: YdeI/OmpD-associated family protein [Spongiibacteraceae bacterium]